jgi:putative ABC transport system permease protein
MRTVEIGIRMAIGADRRAIVRLVVSQALRLAALGIVCGLAGASLASRVLVAQLYQVSPRTPWIYGVAAILFASIGLLASIAPALRAARVDPALSLARS